MPGDSLRFGPFLIDRPGYRVLRHGQPVELTPKLLDLLIYLAEHAGTLVTKEALLDALWPDANVTDNALAQAVSELRDALGDAARSPRFIRTVARRGYRFIARVEPVDLDAPVAGPSDPSAAPPGAGPRDTASLDARRAFAEGSLRLESLEVAQLPQAIADFERAVSIDPRYALAHAGLASARLALYESTRSDDEPAAGELARAIDHARHAVALDDSLGEAHATLGLVLVSASRGDEAAAAARRAVALDPSNWQHLFRLGHATWGTERLHATARLLALFPDFAFGHFEAAMVHVARGHLREAETVLRQGAAVQDRQIGRGGRYPALGLHWLLGLVRLALDDVEEALAEFTREEALADARRLYGREYALYALHGRGSALLRAKRPDAAAAALGRALNLYPHHAPSHLARAMALRQMGSMAEAEQALQEASRSHATLARIRPLEAGLVQPQVLTAQGRPSEAVAALDTLVEQAPPGFAYWTLPVEPLLAKLHSVEGFGAVLGRLAGRAA